MSDWHPAAWIWVISLNQILIMLRSILTLVAFFFAATSYSQLAIEATPYSTRCTGSSTGMVELSTSGAVGSVTYLTNINLTSLAAGSYTLEAVDEGGQSATVTFEILDRPELCGCVYPQAFNYNANAEVDNGSCVFANDQSCLADIVPDGVVGTNDLLQLLSEFGEVCD